MDEKAFLCVSPWPEVYPSEQHGAFEAQHIVAVAEGGVPLLWLALFREGDVRHGPAPVGTDDEREWVEAGAPVAGRERALANLAAAGPALGRLFGPSVAAHAELLRQALQWFPDDWIMVEWWDGVRPVPPDPPDLRAALAAFDDPGQGPGALLRLCRLDPGGLPDPPRPGAPLLPYLHEHAEPLRRLLGRAFDTLVPWEQPI
ncbi:hypothetical protein AB0M46_11280 [Dactylosporangium sp. NPDC051485]|uniref:hypothetical protein n=1 Tax=Dactylosporangium sp. NPDC051485 TaxID=3154846 RepID=UPI0034386974